MMYRNLYKYRIQYQSGEILGWDRGIGSLYTEWTCTALVLKVDIVLLEIMYMRKRDNYWETYLLLLFDTFLCIKFCSSHQTERMNSWRS